MTALSFERQDDLAQALLGAFGMAQLEVDDAEVGDGLVDEARVIQFPRNGQGLLTQLQGPTVVSAADLVLDLPV